MPQADIDFTDTQSSGYLTAGSYRAQLVEVEQKEGREYPLWVWTFSSVEPQNFGRKSQHTTSLSPRAAFYIRQVIEGLGAEVPESLARINTDHYVGREAMILVEADGQFEGRDGQMHDSFKIQRVFPIVGAPPAGATSPLPDDLANVPQVSDDDIPF